MFNAMVMSNEKIPLLDRNFLKVDNTVLNIANDLAMKINMKYAKNINQEDVLVIIESMFRAVPVAVKKGDAIKVPYMGKVCIKPKRFRYLDNDVKDEINRVYSTPNDLALQDIIEGNTNGY